MTNQELQTIAELVSKLTQQKLQVTPHLDIGNFASELFRKLLCVYKLHNDGMLRIEDFNPDNFKLDL